MIQKGRNNFYPQSIRVWKRGEPIPEWLSDRACITAIDLNFKYSLKYRDTTKGGYEIFDSSGLNVLVRAESKEDYICLGDNGKLFSLSPKQLELLYKKENEK